MPAWAGSTGSSQLIDIQGSSSTTAQGDYIASSGGLDTYYSAYVEVPAGLSRLVVDLFDADVGAGGGGEAGANRDRDRGGFDTTASYQLFDPSGSLVASLSGTASAPAGADNAWVSLYDSSSSGAPAFDSVATAVSDFALVTSLTVSQPAGTSAGDLLVFVLSRDGGGGAINVPTGGAGGWTQIDEGACAGSACRLGVFYRIAQAGDPGSYTVGWSGGGEQAVGAILRYTGVDTSNPIDISGAATGTSAGPTAPSVTTTVADTRVVRMYAADDNLISGYPAGHTGRYNLVSSTGFTGWVSGGAADTAQAAAGATGSAAFSLTGSQEWRGVTIAIRPAAGGGGAPTAGHWELRIDQSSAVTGGDDINALGIRAHDGTPGSGGTELAVYFDTFATYGTNDPSLTRSYTHHPWITSGCLFDQNDFDWDSNSGSTGTTDYTSRSGAFTRTVSPLSGNDVWQNTVTSGWTTDQIAGDYGVWDLDASISGYVSGGVDNGNYGQIYLGNSSLADPPPSGQPLSNVFRIYLPTDAGTAPAKPYLEQLLTHVTGPNPPQVGQTSRVSVTVRLVNPTASAITFSTPGDTVTANVPGSGAVYAGGAQVSQGTLVSQPAVGGTGDVVWDPGTVSAGATEILAYRVDVTPTVGGQRIPVTGTPTSAGTTAQYVDETGNTTQTRATYTLGPLCELAASEGVVTHALLRRFGAFSDGGRMVVEWETGSEAGTLGFRLLRRDPERRRLVPLHEGLLPALIGAPQGGVYRFVDEAVSPREAATYLLVEVDRRGRERRFGPFRVAADWSRRAVESFGDGAFTSRARTRVPAPGEVGERDLADAARWTGRPGGGYFRSRPTLKIGVREAGLTFVSAGEIAQGLGIPEPAVRSWIRRGLFQLANRGRAVAWRGAPGGAGLYFYGEALDSLYTRDNVYLLRRGRALSMDEVDLGSPAAAATAPFPESLHAEVDRIAALVLPLDPESDYWFWEGVLSGDPVHGTKTFTVDSPGAAAAGGGDAHLTVHLQGASDSGVAGEHRAQVRINGFELGETSWQGITRHTASFAVDPSWLTDGANTVEVTGVPVSPAPLSAFFVDGFDLAYRRRLEAADGRLDLVPGDNPVVTVTGLPKSEIRVLDVSDPTRPRWGTGITVEAAGKAFSASFVPAGPDAPYLVTSASAVARPVWIEAASPSLLEAFSSGAEYLVIAPASLAPAAEDLAEHRRRFRGLSAAVVELEAIYDTFNHGIPSPQAIRTFLRHARGAWGVPPRFAVLAGDGSYDYRDLLGLGGNLVPPLMASTPDGLFAADARYGDVDGDDGLPEIAVGRIPARTAAELAVYADKIAAYEAAAPPAGTVVLLSDAPDAAADFGHQSEGLVSLLAPRFPSLSLDLGTLSLAEVRQGLFDAVAAESAVVNYFGHGGALSLADEGILTTADVPALNNGGRPMVLTGLTCAVNRFELPGTTTLGEALVLAPEGGAAAVWAPSGLSLYADAEILGRAFYRRLADSSAPVLGEVVVDSAVTFALGGGTPTMLDIYNLLGDPALLLRLAEGGGGPGPGGGELE